MRTKRLVLLSSLALTLLSASAFADMLKVSNSSEIPTSEKEFVAKINGFEKDKILNQFGAPSKQDDVKNVGGKVIASIWQYHNLNTDEKGAYYQTTELDFVNDKVVMVVFMNNDGADLPTAASPESTPEAVSEVLPSL
ncbi:MAG TPA: hypothetical protein VGJ90_13125 [Methylophilaceae bacterium]|jgi:hypothetical protein